jgi:putative oligomerization/nucleic acid binding protein
VAVPPLPASVPPPQPFAFQPAETFGLVNSSRRLLVGLLSLAAGVTAGVAALESWWTFWLSGPSWGSSEFLPGDSTRFTTNGASGSQTYASQGLGQLGTLYEGILVICVVSMILFFAGGILAILGSLGKLRHPTRHRVVRNLSVIALGLLLTAAVMLPVLQPPIFRGENQSVCGGTNGTQTPCTSFWGSLTAGSETLGWGAGVGWYLAVAIIIVTVAMLVIWRSSAHDPWERRPPAWASAFNAWHQPGSPAVAPGAPYDRLAQLKNLADSGLISPVEFEQAKGRILGAPAGVPPYGSTSPPTDLATELRNLKSMHDAGTITDSEYQDLRTRMLLRY